MFFARRPAARPVVSHWLIALGVATVGLLLQRQPAHLTDPANCPGLLEWLVITASGSGSPSTPSTSRPTSRQRLSAPARCSSHVVSPAFMSVIQCDPRGVLGTKKPITQLRGEVYDFHGIKAVATFNPAYVLRDPTKKREVWEDMKLVRDTLIGVYEETYRAELGGAGE